MPLTFLEFEQPIAELEAKIDELKFVSSDAEVNIGEDHIEGICNRAMDMHQPSELSSKRQCR